MTTATRKILKLRKRIRAVAGGTSASKTISILLCLIDTAQTLPDKVITVVGESLPHLKIGAMRDFLKIMKEHNYYDDTAWNKSESIYRFPTGTTIEFFGADSPTKVYGARRDILYVNEANNISLEAFNQMEMRTTEVIWLDWNPTAEFWFYTDVLVQRAEDVEFITLTYLDNESCPQSIVRAIEARKGNVGWWKVYGLGQLGDFEGRIFTGWDIVPEVAREAKLVRRGLDFGFTNDPTAIIDLYYLDGGYILDEVCHQHGMSNKAIADLCLSLPRAVIIADSAEPKSIAEIRSHGLQILPADKGKGSINYGIQVLQGEKISMTSRSVNLIREYRNYAWVIDKNGKNTNIPVDFDNHCIDALRYAITSMKNKRKLFVHVS